MSGAGVILCCTSDTLRGRPLHMQPRVFPPLPDGVLQQVCAWLVCARTAGCVCLVVLYASGCMLGEKQNHGCADILYAAECAACPTIRSQAFHSAMAAACGDYEAFQYPFGAVTVIQKYMEAVLNAVQHAMLHF